MIKIKTKLIKKIRINRNFRFSIIVILGLLIIASAYSAYAVSQPASTEKTITCCHYDHYGHFNYVTYLKNNTIYNNATMLYPGQGKIFKRITDHINASFSYTFNCDQSATIQKASYTVVPKIQTDLWNKTCAPIIDETTFDSTHISTHFPLNYAVYENIVTQIANETGIDPREPTLIITCTIDLSANTINRSISESFSLSLSIPLMKNIIDVNGNLSRSEEGTVQETKTIITPGDGKQAATLGVVSIGFLFILAGFVVLTNSKTTIITATEKQVNKIKKKYGEWIVEINKPPQFGTNSEAISTKSMEDLSKISEELGKPIIHYNPENSNDEHHIFYVFDDPTVYEYILH